MMPAVTGDFDIDRTRSLPPCRLQRTLTAKLNLDENAAPLAELQVSGATFKVKDRAGEKEILKGIDLTIQGGETLAILGPSGAGKTTLLELMTLQLKGGEVAGTVKLNGRELTADMFRDHAFYVEQYDTHWAFLTCREIMEYSAGMFMQEATKAEQAEKVNLMMVNLGLEGCSNTRAGNEFFKGMSGGQKKRLTLGLALLKGAALLFLDEPTSGLDASATSSVMRFLDKMAHEAGMIAVATIHQPSTEVFMSFSSVMFMANGRVAYHGKPQQIQNHCGNIGFPLPEQTNPADHFINLVNSDFAGQEQVDRVVEQCVQTHPKIRYSADDVPQESQKRFCSQLCTLFRRQALISVRDPSVYFGRMASFLIANSLFAVVYWNARELSQEYVIPRFFLLGWLGAVPTLLSAVGVYAFNQQFKLMSKEVKNGLFARRTYLLTTIALEVPYVVLMALSAVVIPLYVVSTGNWAELLSTILVMVSALWCFECLAQMFGILFTNPLTGMLGMLALWIVSFLFSGIFLKPDQIVWFLKDAVYLMPLFYCFRALHHVQFLGTLWDGAELSDVVPGFKCTQPGPCYGRTGEQVLKSLSGMFVSSEQDTVTRDIAVILLMGLLVKLVSISIMVARTRGSKPGASPVQKVLEEATSSEEV